MRTSPIRIILIAVLLCAAALSGLIVWNVQQTRLLVEAARQRGDAIAAGDVEKAKAREEYISKRFENDSRGIIVNFLLSNFGTAVTLIGALGGGIIALYGYIDARRKEALDRAASDLKDTLSHLASKEPQERVVGVVGLQHFLVPERSEFHRAAVTALAAAARMETHPEVIHSIRIAVEQAMKAVGKDVLTQVSWQNVKADNVDLADLHLEGLDLRDASLRDSRLDGTWLTGARLNAAKLQGAKLAGAHLERADLTYADLAGASLAGADLTGAKFSRTSVQNLDLADARLERLDVDWETVPWEQTRNWRSARFDESLRNKLLQRYGRAPSGARILMLMWEIPPYVAGGTWTACYHLVRNLVRDGADLTIVVPWNDASILTAPFGSEVKIVPMGIRLPPQFASPYGAADGRRGGLQQASPYAPPAWSPYAQPARYPYAGAYGSPYGAPAWSPYADPPWSPYAAPTWSPYGPPVWSPYYRPPPGPYPHASGARPGRGPRSSAEGSILLRLIDEFRERVGRYVESAAPDLIHAHDWVTFEAAREASRRSATRDKTVPWIAHVHSIEMERRPEGPDPVIERLEQNALAEATAVVTPSRITARHVCVRYQVEPELVRVIPNVLSSEPINMDEMGLFESGRVVFLGRSSQQKGLDRFFDIARTLRARGCPGEFHVYGSGEPPMSNAMVSFHGPLLWERRGEAFRGASVLLVPSRSEPFGMVIVEAMLHRVPVIYPDDSGAAEVLTSGVKFDQRDFTTVADFTERLLTDFLYWEDVVERQVAEIDRYCERGFERALLELWRALAEPATIRARSLPRR